MPRLQKDTDTEMPKMLMCGCCCHCCWLFNCKDDFHFYAVD